MGRLSNARLLMFFEVEQPEGSNRRAKLQAHEVQCRRMRDAAQRSHRQGF
jgi:hypothetical protein